MRATLRVALATALTVVAFGPATPARAESAAEATAAAHRVATEVAALQPKAAAALLAYETALGDIGTSVGRSLTAQASADAAARRADAERAGVATQVRSLYMSGGATALFASLLDARSIDDLARRVALSERLTQIGVHHADSAERANAELTAAGTALRADADRSIVTASQVAGRYATLLDLLAQQRARLASLSAHARTLAEAERAAAVLKAIEEATARAAAERAAQARAVSVAADYLSLYHAAALTCPGLSWSVLAAIGQVESGHGRNVGPSPNGAMGPMQFLPTTFGSYAADGSGDGIADILDPADSIYSAARYLCANGAGAGGASLERAIWHYNNADWYVRLVLALAAQLAPLG